MSNNKQHKKNNKKTTVSSEIETSPEQAVAPQAVETEQAAEPTTVEAPIEVPVESPVEEIQASEPISQENETREQTSEVISSLPYSEKVEQLLQGLGNGEKPWFLSTTEIYKTAKDSVSSIPKGKEYFDQSLVGLSQLTKKINESTKLNVAFEVSQSYELITKLDNMLAENLIVVDDGFDGMRAQISSKLRQLIVAVIKHKDWAEDCANQTKAITTETIQTRYEQALGMLQNLMKEVEKRFPETYAQVANAVQHSYNRVELVANYTYDCAGKVTETAEKVYQESLNKINSTIEDGKNKVNEIQHKIDETVFGLLFYSLKTAQPLIHQAIEQTVPYLNQAIIVSKPLIEQSKPFVEPLLHKAVDVNSNLKENKYFGSYVSKANDAALKFVHETTNYCIPASVEIVSF